MCRFIADSFTVDFCCILPMIMKQFDVLQKKLCLVDLFKVDQTTDTDTSHEPVFSVEVRHELQNKLGTETFAKWFIIDRWTLTLSRQIS